jgi:virulence-associated protein VagC
MKSCKRKTGIAKLLRNARSPATRSPRELRSPDDHARMQRVAQGSLSEPVDTDITQWFAEWDRFNGEPFMNEGRRQPRTPRHV